MTDINPTEESAAPVAHISKTVTIAREGMGEVCAILRRAGRDDLADNYQRIVTFAEHAGVLLPLHMQAHDAIAEHAGHAHELILAGHDGFEIMEKSIRNAGIDPDNLEIIGGVALNERLEKLTHAYNVSSNKARALAMALDEKIAVLAEIARGWPKKDD